MPIYEFQCQKCKEKEEYLLSMTEKKPEKCLKCEGELKQIISQSSFKLEGTGWYVTDYKGK